MAGVEVKTEVKTSIPSWVVRHSKEGKELEELHRYNSNRSIHGEWIHEDRFRYSHKTLTDSGESRGFTCGTKYDPNDTSKCPFCQGYKYNRPYEEILTVARGIFNMPRRYNMERVIEDWKAGRIPTEGGVKPLWNPFCH